MNDTLDLPSAVSVNALVFSGGEVWGEETVENTPAHAILQSLAQSAVSGPSDAKPSESRQSNREQNVSIYVRVFEDMITTVIKEERHLLNDEEVALLTIFAHLSYGARFLIIKLLLRKQEIWHRLDALKYERELGSTSAIVSAIDELCRAGRRPSDVVKRNVPDEQDFVDFVVENTHPDQDGAALADVGNTERSSTNGHLAFARSEQDMDLQSLLECLRVDELKDIARKCRVTVTKFKKDDLIRNLLSTTSSQSTLTNFACKSGATPSKNRVYHQTKLPFGKLESQQDKLRDIAIQCIGKCVRVDEEFFGVIHRVNVVFFRMTQHADSILVAALLTRFGKRAYPTYKYERTGNIWPSREALLEYAEALHLEGRVDALLAGNAPLFGGRAGSKTPAPGILPTPIASSSAKGRRVGRDLADEDMEQDVKIDTTRIQGARIVKELFEQVYHRWKNLVEINSDEDVRPNGLERFHCGHVLTRIVCKSSAALGTLGEHEQELDVLEALLAQRRWRRGQRGRWHNRRSLILSTHLGKEKRTVERAFDAVVEGLKDLDTHIVYRPKLQRRLKRLENKLKIPADERHSCDGILGKAQEVVMEAVRLRHRAVSLKLDKTGRHVEAKASPLKDQDITRYYSPTTPVAAERGPIVVQSSRQKLLSETKGGKSLWLGRNGEELTVESLALQRYEEQGFKGLHCETRVITMLFSLLFWDIIFAPIPGAFETPFQTAPLDIAEDSFYHARKDLIEKRLMDIESGGGVDLVRAVDAEHRASKTWCVGVQWDLFSSEDLVDIVTCIGGEALSVICRVLCEDYIFGTSGGPDLFLWDVQRGTCKFVEVKGPGDNLQENQRVWIDILLKAPVSVEICRVIEEGEATDKKPNVRTPKSIGKKVKKTRRGNGDEDDADALPIVYDSHMALIGQPPYTEETSSPLKRKVGPRAASPTPSKRQRAL